MEDEWLCDRDRLRQLWREHPDWRVINFARALNRSPGWVARWLARFRQADPDDDTVLASQSRAPKHPQFALSALVMAAILALRLTPPQNLHRVPGPKTILASLRCDPTLAEHDLPRSSRTVYRVLKAAGLIPERARRGHEPVERPAPLLVWEIDFKENRFVWRDADGKQQHLVEVLVTIDTGTSLLLDLTVRDDFTAETTLLAMAEVVQRHGLPQRVRFDRDPRFVGNTPHGDFPSAFVRFWLCLGVEVDLCAPHRPQDKGFVERVNRTLEEECLQIHQPRDLGDTRTATETFLPHYNHERSNQARTCQNQPPASAFPDLPALPRVPEQVDPDGWVLPLHGLRITRMVGKDGRISVDKQAYYVGTAYQGQRVGVRLDGRAGQLVMERHGKEIKRVALKGLQQRGPIPFADWLGQLQQEAIAEQRKQRGGRSRSSGKRASTGWMAALQEAVAQVRATHPSATLKPSSPEPASPEGQRLADELGEIPF
jgi:hypothetical protein